MILLYKNPSILCIDNKKFVKKNDTFGTSKIKVEK